MTPYATGDGDVGLATFSNYDETTKYFILRQSGTARIVYVVTGLNY